MPCYDPDPERKGAPGPFELSEAKKREQLLQQAICRCVDTLKAIEKECKGPSPVVRTRRILDIIHEHWSQP